MVRSKQKAIREGGLSTLNKPSKDASNSVRASKSVSNIVKDGAAKSNSAINKISLKKGLQQDEVNSTGKLANEITVDKKGGNITQTRQSDTKAISLIVLNDQDSLDTDLIQNIPMDKELAAALAMEVPKPAAESDNSISSHVVKSPGIIRYPSEVKHSISPIRPMNGSGSSHTTGLNGETGDVCGNVSCRGDDSSLCSEDLHVFAVCFFIDRLASFMNAPKRVEMVAFELCHMLDRKSVV